LKIRRLHPTLLAPALVFAGLSALTGAGTASASTAAPGWYVCSGTARSPGVLTGNFARVLVRGRCVVNAGPAYVRGPLIIAPHGTLVAAFALNDTTGRGSSNLRVGGDLTVLRRAALIMGCAAADFPCLDDPNQASPTLGSTSSVGGSLIARGALGVVVHDSTIGTSVIQTGGGGGRDCTPKGIFKQTGSPVYSDYEDTFIGRNLLVAGLRSCWYGTLRDTVRGSVLLFRNKLADPDAMEVVSNRIHRNFRCFGNSPAPQFGDSGGMSNRVRGRASGQCGFGVFQPNPAPGGPLQRISIRVRFRHLHHM
jgi:hypothetical protein